MCKSCGNTSEIDMHIYPIEAASSFLDFVDRNIYDIEDFNVQFDLYNFEGFETTSLFLCTAYEVLLETLIIDLLNAMKTPKKVAELLITTNQGQEKMGRMLAYLIGKGKTIKPVFEHIGYEKFHSKLKKLIKYRNSYIHGDHRAFKDSNIEAEDLKFISDSMIIAFVELNNLFVYKTTGEFEQMDVECT
ncbi:MAG: hypothetical protein K0S34_416 [Bacillales bacterium]|jgi:hypothetical protein|nr:hypothetical protein [Bacillales bacterium]